MRLDFEARRPDTQLLPTPPPLPLLCHCKEQLLLLVYHTIKPRGTNYPPVRGEGHRAHREGACVTVLLAARLAPGCDAPWEEEPWLGACKVSGSVFMCQRQGAGGARGMGISEWLRSTGSARPDIRNRNAVQNLASQHLSSP